MRSRNETKIHAIAGLSGFFALVMIPADAFAEVAPSITLEAEANKVGIGEVVQVMIEVSTEGTKPEKISLPSFKGFEVVSKSVSSPLQFSFGMGTGVKMTYSTRYDLGLMAKSEGTHRIGPVIVKMGDKEFKSGTIVVEATKEPQGVGKKKSPDWPGSPFGPDPFKDFDDMFKRPFGRGQPPATEPPKPPEDIIPASPPPEGLDGAKYDPYVFVRTVVKPLKVYIGQQATLDFYLYHRVNVVNIDRNKDPAGGKFWTKDLLPPTGKVDFTPVEIGGISFSVATLRKIAIFPTEAGLQEIEPGKVTVSTGLGGIFGGKTYERSGVPVMVEVVPLPVEGRPDNFNPANIGKYTISTKLGAKEAVQDQPLSVQFIISGTGNIEMVRPPEVKFPEDVKVYDPQVTDSIEIRHSLLGGKKKTEYIIIPTKEGKLAIPQVSFSYFDPVAEKYVTVETKPMEIKVEPSSFAGGGPVVEGGGEYGSDDGEDRGIGGLRSIITVASLKPPSSQFIRSKWFIWAIAVPPALLVLMLLISLVRYSAGRMKKRSPSSRALREARRILKESTRSKEREVFYQRIQNAIYRYIEMKLDIPASGMTNAELTRALEEAGIDTAGADNIIQELENCEFARYGRSTDVSEDIKDAAMRVEEILESIEKEVQKNPAAGGKNAKGKVSAAGAAAMFLLVLLFSPPSAAENVRQIFDGANDLYFKGQYREAIEEYYGIINLGIEDTGVYFNTASAFAKLGEYGKAIYFYDKVLKIKPRDTATQRNLAIVRSALGREISNKERDINIRPKETLWEGAVSWFSANELVVIFLVFYYLFFVMLLVRKLMKKQVSKIGVTIAIFFFLLMWIVAGAMVTLKYNIDFLRKEGVVVDKGLVVAREGPTEESNRKFDVAEGQLIKIKDTRGGWIRIEDEKGREGWLQKPQVGVL